MGRLQGSAWLCYVCNICEAASADSQEAAGNTSLELGAELGATDINLRTCHQLRNGILAVGLGEGTGESEWTEKESS